MKKSILYLTLMLLMTIITGCPGAVDSLAWKELGHDYIYHETGGLPCIEKKSLDKGIPEMVVEYNYDNEFIIALTKKLMLKESEKTKLINGNGLRRNLLKKGSKGYWIITLVNDSIYGPFNSIEYLQKRKELKVPKKLELKDILKNASVYEQDSY